jgi:DNA-binding IclR family transcriptional regulator
MSVETTPALERGIQILRLLKGRENMSLEEISQSIQAPKPSVSRLLATLEDMGVIMRDKSSKRYRPLQVLMPVNGVLGEQQIKSCLTKLAASTHRRAEFYTSSSAGMTITQVASPLNSEVTVNAQVGFLRNWSSELEAVCAVAFAFSPDAPALPAVGIPRAGLLGEVLNVGEVKGVIEGCRRQMGRVDEVFNSWGVRRLAAPAIGSDGTFYGILALAETSLHPEKDHFSELLGTLQEQIAGVLR